MRDPLHLSLELSSEASHERWALESTLDEMLAVTPSNINNDPGALTQWLLVFDRWPIQEIGYLLPDLIRRRAK
jgi:hypothetical protein